MKVAELKTVRWALGVTRKNRIRNQYVRGTAKIAKLGDKTLECKAMLVWTREKERRRLHGKKDDGDSSAQWKEKRPRRRWMDLAREDMKRVGAKEGDEIDRVWGLQIERSKRKSEVKRTFL